MQTASALYDAFQASDAAKFASILAEVKNAHELDQPVTDGIPLITAICARSGPGDEMYLDAILRRGAYPGDLVSTVAPFRDTKATREIFHPFAALTIAQWRNFDMFRIMLEYGADIEYSAEPGKLLRNLCMTETHPRIVQLIRLAMAHGARDNYQYKHPAIGTLNIKGILAMLISPTGHQHNFRQSQYPAMTRAILKLLCRPVPRRVLPAASRAAKFRLNALEDAAAEQKRQAIAAAAATPPMETVATAAAPPGGTAEGLALISHAVTLIESLESGAALPAALRESIRTQIQHLFIKAGQIMPPEALAGLTIPPGYECLTQYKGAFKVYWEH